MLEEVGDFYVDLSEFPVEIVNRAHGVLIIGEHKLHYPGEFFRFHKIAGDVINLSNFLPHWIVLTRDKLQKAEALAKELNLKIPE